MKRITYMSKISGKLLEKEIESIGVYSRSKNNESGITGLLVYFQGLFFQIIEGSTDEVDRLYRKIGDDPRHKDILCLKTETDVDERLFPNWSMKMINLDQTTDELLLPIRILLQTIVESHSIIRSYTQPSILKILNQGINPLLVPANIVDKVIMFGDIKAYSTLSKNLSQEDILHILNTYFGICNKIVDNNGGEINKYLGDGIMAYFDNPDSAINASLEILKDINSLRQNTEENSVLRLLHSGFGLAQGQVIEGNMGSNIKTDYTIIGDAVNVASRLEGLTRETNCSLVVSNLVKNNAKKQWPFIGLGKYNLKGQEELHEVFTIDSNSVRRFPSTSTIRETLNQISSFRNEL